MPSVNFSEPEIDALILRVRKGNSFNWPTPLEAIIGKRETKALLKAGLIEKLDPRAQPKGYIGRARHYRITQAGSFRLAGIPGSGVTWSKGIPAP